MADLSEHRGELAVVDAGPPDRLVQKWGLPL
jgi:hypothetical protein